MNVWKFKKYFSVLYWVKNVPQSESQDILKFDFKIYFINNKNHT